MNTSNTDTKTITLLHTKFHMPRVPGDLINRPHLLERLNRGLDRKLTLISSPTGFGKTILMSEFAAGCERPVAWYSIDGEDDDATRFMSYLIACLESINEGWGASIPNWVRFTSWPRCIFTREGPLSKELIGEACWA